MKTFSIETNSVQEFVDELLALHYTHEQIGQLIVKFLDGVVIEAQDQLQIIN